MDIKRKKLFAVFMCILMLVVLAASVGYWAYTREGITSYEEAEKLYKNIDAETTTYVITVNQTELLDNASGLNAWMVQVNWIYGENHPAVSVYGKNFTHQLVNDTKADGKYSLAINRTYANATKNHTTSLWLYNDVWTGSNYEQIIWIEERLINSNEISYYICSRDYTLTTYHAKVVFGDKTVWLTLNVVDGVNENIYT